MSETKEPKVERNNRITAAFDNQVGVFLTHYCQEAPEYREKGVSLYLAYCKVHSQITQPGSAMRGPYHNRYMTQPSFYTRLEASGLYSERGRNDRNGVVVWFHGVRLNSDNLRRPVTTFVEYIPSTEDAPAIIKPKPTQVQAQVQVQLLQAQLPQAQLPQAQLPVPTPPATGSITKPVVVLINGAAYARELIATIKPITGFVRHDTREFMRAIVTFRNPELRHQYVTELDAIRISQELGIEISCTKTKKNAGATSA